MYCSRASCLTPQVLELELDLLLDREDAVRQQPAQLERSRSSSGKARSLVSSRLPSSAGPASPIGAGRPAAMSSKGRAAGASPRG